MERKRVIVAFGDIRGFRKWTLRAINDPEIAGNLIDHVYEIFERFSKETGYYVKYLGDGLFASVELSNGHSCGVARKFTLDLHRLCKNIQDALKAFYPRPEGFRVRVAAGHVWKRSVMGRPEYIGYAINMAQALLYVYPERGCICHRSVVEIMGKKRGGMSFKAIPPPQERRNGVDPADFAELFIFEPETGKRA